MCSPGADDTGPVSERFDLSDGDPPIAPLQHVIGAHVLSAVRACGGNKTHAARALGVNRRTLYRLLAKHGVVD